MISELIDKMFQRNKDDYFKNSREQAKHRLKLVIAHDRAQLSPGMMESMRREILEVVSNYVEIDPGEMEFSLTNDDRMSVLIANLPIRRIKNPKQKTNTKIKEEATSTISNSLEKNRK